jgi:ubiquinone/menaquinone biosynthesis C-methylase UbiE
MQADFIRHRSGFSALVLFVAMLLVGFFIEELAADEANISAPRIYKGRVITTDIQPQMLAFLKDNLRATGVKNIDLILCTPTDAKLPENALDLALMVDVYHELAYPEETIMQVRRALKSNGRLVLVEYRGEDPRVPIKPEHKTTLAQVRTEIEPLGFHMKEVFEFLVYQRIIVFVKKGE